MEIAKISNVYVYEFQLDNLKLKFDLCRIWYVCINMYKYIYNIFIYLRFNEQSNKEQKESSQVKYSLSNK